MRHEILRTTLALVGERLVQNVNTHLPVEVPLVDLQTLPASHREKEVARLAAAQAREPLDLSRGPILRMKVLRLGPEEHVLILAVHHAAFDAMSHPIFWRELSSLYESRRKNEESPLVPLRVQYADYAIWQRAWLEGEVLGRELGYWKRKLADAPYLELPTDRPRPSQRVNRGAGFSFSFDATLSRDVRLTAIRQQTTIFAVLLAGWSALLAQYSGQDDVVVGTTFSNRPVSDVEELVGPFISGVALRTDVSGDPTAAELIRRMHDLAVETRDHIDVSFAHVVRELGVSRDPSRTPLYPVMFIVLPGADPPSVAQGALFESVPTDPFGLAPFEITLWVVERAERLHAYFEYSTVLFDAPTIERMAVHLMNTVAAMVS